MKKINLPQAARITPPNPLSLVCTLKPGGGTNLAAVSWRTIPYCEQYYADIRK